MGTTKNNSKSIVDFFKENPWIGIAIVYAAAVLVLILVGVLAWNEPIVPVCLALMLEAGIAIMLHNVELWIHGAAVMVELVAGILIGRVRLMILCVILYALTIAALQLIAKTERA
jgi:hypothetical protein